MARAIYSEADIYLLDDPLSAVDPQVASDIFNKAICDALKDKLVILVTHQLQFLSSCDKILVIKDGQQSVMGDFKTITTSGFNIEEILQSLNKSMSKGAKSAGQGFKAEVKGIARKLTKQAQAQGVVLDTQMADGDDDSEDDGALKQELEAELFADEDAAKDQEKEKKEDDGELIQEEEVDTGRLGCQDISNYFSFSYGCFNWVIYVTIGLVTAFLQLFTTFIVSYWADRPFEEQQSKWYPIVFGISVLVYILMSFIRALIIFGVTLKSSRNMHDAMVDAVIRAPVLFYDKNPIGRMQTRFSKDVSTLDMLVPMGANFMSTGLFRTITVFAVVCYLQPILLVIIAIAGCFMYCSFSYAANLMIQSQRMDSVYRGPLNSGMTNILTGLVPVRSYERIKHFKERFIDDLDKSCNATFSFFVATRVLGQLLDYIAIVFTFSVSTFTLLYKVDPAQNTQLSFALQIITDVIVFFSVSLRFIAELENNLTSSQRIFEYTQEPSEDALVKDIDFEILKIEGAKPVVKNDDVVE